MACSYSPEQLYHVVSKVEDYKEFVPWCERSTVIQRPDESYMEAELEVGFKVFVERCAPPAPPLPPPPPLFPQGAPPLETCSSGAIRPCVVGATVQANTPLR